jgi:cobalt-zinc-cadmium efflux system membrane fusion protein
MKTMDDERRPLRWPGIAAIALAAALTGFGAAYMLIPSVPPAPANGPAAAPSDNGPKEVRIPAAYVASANIGVEPARSGGVDSDIMASATVASLPGGEGIVVARASGTVTRLLRRLGDQVRAGETVALVDSLDAATMSADRSVAIAKVQQARRVYDREAGLFRQGVTARQDMEAAQSALAIAEAEARRAGAIAQAAHVTRNGSSVAVVAPIGGRITALSVTVGAFVDPRTELLRIAGNGAVQVEAAVPAADARRLAAGDAATILSGTAPPIPGIVRSVAPAVSGASQSAVVVITPQTGASDLSIGEGVQVRIQARGTPSVGVSVPEEAVQNVDGRDIVFVRTAAGFRVQPVTVGTRSGGLAQIVGGLKAGERVASRNAFLVKAEMSKGGDEE